MLLHQPLQANEDQLVTYQQNCQLAASPKNIVHHAVQAEECHTEAAAAYTFTLQSRRASTALMLLLLRGRRAMSPGDLLEADTAWTSFPLRGFVPRDHPCT